MCWKTICGCGPACPTWWKAARVWCAADPNSRYPFVPDRVRCDLSETPSRTNVPTWQCRKPDDLAYTLAHLAELLVKEVQGAGGYGMLIGPASSQQEIENFRQRLLAN